MPLSAAIAQNPVTKAIVATTVPTRDPTSKPTHLIRSLREPLLIPAKKQLISHKASAFISIRYKEVPTLPF